MWLSVDTPEAKINFQREPNATLGAAQIESAAPITRGRGLQGLNVVPRPLARRSLSARLARIGAAQRNAEPGFAGAPSFAVFAKGGCATSSPATNAQREAQHSRWIAVGLGVQIRNLTARSRAKGRGTTFTP